MEIVLKKSSKAEKKFQVTIDGKKTVHFGAKGMSDFTISKDPEKKSRYIARHKARENWTKSGIKTAGFWSKHLLWNQPSLSLSIGDVSKKFNISIKYQR